MKNQSCFLRLKLPLELHPVWPALQLSESRLCDVFPANAVSKTLALLGYSKLNNSVDAQSE